MIPEPADKTEEKEMDLSTPGQPESAPEAEMSEPGQVTASPATPEAPPAPDKPARKINWGGIFLDSALVLVLLGIIGGGAWFLNQELASCRVPSPMELAQAEHLELCRQHEALQNQAYQADEQIHMRERLSRLEHQLADTRRQIEEINRNISAEHARVLAVQREIRQEDKTSRSVARSLLIGLPIGNAARTNGKVYQRAIIHRLENGRISLRTATGPVSFPLNQLVKENLPDMARYAFGLDDMVDMSDFEAAPGSPEPRKRRQGRLITPGTKAHPAGETSYEPTPAAPVVNTQAPPADSALMPEDDGSWQAPQEALPIAE